MKRNGKYNFEVDSYLLISPKKLAELKDISISSAYTFRNLHSVKIDGIGRRFIAASIPTKDQSLFNIKVFNLDEFYKERQNLWVKPAVIAQLICCSREAVLNLVKNDKNKLEAVYSQGNGWLINIKNFIKFIEWGRL